MGEKYVQQNFSIVCETILTNSRFWELAIWSKTTVWRGMSSGLRPLLRCLFSLLQLFLEEKQIAENMWIFLLKVLSGLQIFCFSKIPFCKLCDQKNFYMKDVKYTNKSICPDSREGNRCAHVTEDTQDLRGMKTTQYH